MVITTDWMSANYAKYNKILFGNKLPHINFLINNRMKSYGRASAQYKLSAGVMLPKSIAMTTYRDCDEKYHLDTLVHEMIHIYDYECFPEHYITYYSGEYVKVKDYNSHGSWFLGECERINQMNLGFEVTPYASKEYAQNVSLSPEFQAKLDKKTKNGVFIEFRKYSEDSKIRDGIPNVWGVCERIDKDAFNNKVNDTESYYDSNYYKKSFTDVYLGLCHDPVIASMRANSIKLLNTQEFERSINATEIKKSVVIQQEKEKIDERYVSIINTMGSLFKKMCSEKRKKGKSFFQSYMEEFDQSTGLKVGLETIGSKFFFKVFNKYGKLIYFQYPYSMSIFKGIFSNPDEIEGLAVDMKTYLDKNNLKLENMKSYKKIIRETLENYLNKEAGEDIKVSGLPGQRKFEKEITDDEGIICIE